MVFVAIGAAFLGFVFTLLLRWPCQALGLVDVPDARKQHGCVVPVTGGPAVAIAVVSVALAPQLRAELEDWRLTAAVISLAPVGTDINTPAAFRKSQVDTWAALQGERATLQRLVAEQSEELAQLRRPWWRKAWDGLVAIWQDPWQTLAL